MSRLAVTGYASLDYVLALSGEVVPDRTTHACRDTSAWPRPGGCPTYIAMAAAAAGQVAAPVMWLGDDAEGRRLMESLSGLGVDCKGIALMPGTRSPAAVMAYQPDAGCACLYDPGPAGQESLSASQRALIAGASHLCISVGPGHLIDEIVALRTPSTRLYWAVKDDPACFSSERRRVLAREADVIFCSAAERALIGPTRATIVETRGASRVTIETDGQQSQVPVSPVQANDTTGAGDTFAGAFIAAQMAGKTVPERAAEEGIEAARRLLTSRQRTSR
ncbi:MAG: carbohydrate kinase family protein [Phaeobacter italicus]